MAGTLRGDRILRFVSENSLVAEYRPEIHIRYYGVKTVENQGKTPGRRGPDLWVLNIFTRGR